MSWPQLEYPHDPKWVKGRNAFRCCVCDRRVHFKASTKKPSYPLSRCPGTEPDRPRPVRPAPSPLPATMSSRLPFTSEAMLLVAAAEAIIGDTFLDPLLLEPPA